MSRCGVDNNKDDRSDLTNIFLLSQLFTSTKYIQSNNNYYTMFDYILLLASLLLAMLLRGGSALLPVFLSRLTVTC